MNRELGIFFRDRLLTLPWVSKAVGLVKTIENQKEVDGKILTARFPASLDVVGDVKPGEYIDAIPEGLSYKNLFYTEDFGTRVVEKTSRGILFESTVRLVGWMDHQYKQGGDTLAIAAILNVIPERTTSVGDLHNVVFKPGRILGVEDRLFSRYTYSEHVKQFLMAPYSAFAIDYTVSYAIAPNCVPEYSEETPAQTFIATPLSSREILLTWN